MLNRLFDRILISLACVAAATIVCIALSIDFEVVMRYFFNRPIGGVIDFSEYGLLYILFLTAAWVLAREGHVKVDLLLAALPSRRQRVLNIITSLVGALACAIFFCFGVWITWEAFEAGALLWKATFVPKWPIYMIIPFGSLLLSLQFLRRAWLYWSRHGMLEKGES